MLKIRRPNGRLIFNMEIAIRRKDGLYIETGPWIRLIFTGFNLAVAQQALSNTFTVYPKKYAHSFVVLCFVVVMQSFIMNSHEVFIHIHQGCFAGTGAIVRLPQCQWSKPDGYGKISQCITTTKHSKAVTVCIFLGIYCTFIYVFVYSSGYRLSFISLEPFKVDRHGVIPAHISHQKHWIY